MDNKLINYDLGRKNQGHAIWDVSDRKRRVLYPDIRGRCLKFLHDISAAEAKDNR